MTKTTPNDDEIITEVRAIREQIAARFDYDLERIHEYMKQQEKTSPGPFIEPAPKRMEKRKAAG